MATVGPQELCRILAGEGNPALTAMALTKLVKQGMPKEDRGQYDPVRCMFWYLGRLRRSVHHKETANDEGGTSNLQAERKRLVKMQADREELNLAKARGEVIAIADHEAILADMAMEVKARVMGVGPRVAPKLVGLESRVQVQAVLETAHKEVLVDLSKRVPQLKPEPEPAKKAKRGKV